MHDAEKFEVFKQNAIQKNEEQFGREVRKKYGDEAVNASQQKMLKMSEADYQQFQNLETEILQQLESAVKTGQPYHSEAARQIVLLHKDWLSLTWEQYSAEAHKAVAQMYVADDRFRMYYDKNVAGCAELLEEAICYWIES